MKTVMATAAKTVYAHITKEPGVCGGKPTIDSARVRVMDVAWLHKEGYTTERIRQTYPELRHEDEERHQREPVRGDKASRGSAAAAPCGWWGVRRKA
jgi:uncharacterized protein (DUF433 family)